MAVISKSNGLVMVVRVRMGQQKQTRPMWMLVRWNDVLSCERMRSLETQRLRGRVR